jgi:hypothetical protein
MSIDGTAIATIVLAGVTLALALSTQSMARTTARSFALERRPYLAHSGCKFEVSNAVLNGVPERMRLALEFENVGHVIANYELRSIALNYNGQAVQTGAALRRGAVFPTKKDTLWITLGLVPADGVPLTIRFDVSYWASGATERFATRATVTGTILPPDPRGPNADRRAQFVYEDVPGNPDFT